MKAYFKRNETEKENSPQYRQLNRAAYKMAPFASKNPEQTISFDVTKLTPWCVKCADSKLVLVFAYKHLRFSTQSLHKGSMSL